MKKLILAIVAMLTISLSASAMSYEQAREQALFLTDKMAYELNLTDDQYEAAYEVNLDYLLGVNGYDDLYGVYWRQRNTDLSYILLDWQYRAYLNATYFYRPLYWDGGYFHFGIYARYPHRDYFFFGRPAFYASYRGAHAWHMNGGRSWYHGREFGQRRPGEQQRIGMRDGFNKGDYGRGTSFGNMQRNNRNTGVGFSRGSQQPAQQGRTYGSRQSSTRTTVNGNGSFGSQRRSSSYGNNGTSGSRSVGNNSGSGRSNIFGGNRSTTTQRNNSAPSQSRSFTPRSTNSTSSFGSSSRSFGGSRSTGSSMGGGSRNGGGSHSNGGGFGGRR